MNDMKEQVDKIVRNIKKQATIIFYENKMYEYIDGVYKKLNEYDLKGRIKKSSKAKLVMHQIKEVIEHIKIESFVKEISDNGYLSLKNGLFDLNAYKIIAHDPKYVFFHQLNANYHAEAVCDLWNRTLVEIFEDDTGKIQLFQEFCGLCLTKDVSFQKALFLYGNGGNGKSTLLTALMNLLGDGNYSTLGLDQFAHRFSLCLLSGKLLNVTTEVSSKKSICDEKFKAITTGNEITVEEKGVPMYSLKPYCKLIFDVNKPPRVDDRSDGYFRRAIILKFNRKFTELDRDTGLDEKLIKELDGIFLWAVEGYKRLKENGCFTITENIECEVKEYRFDNSNVLMFTEESCIISENGKIDKKDLFNAYKRWCDSCNCRPLSMHKFGKELKIHFSGIEEGRKATSRFWKGIVLNVQKDCVFDVMDKNK